MSQGQDIYVIGAGGHARVVADVIAGLDDWAFAEFIAPDGEEAFLAKVKPEETFIVVGIGENTTRQAVYQRFKEGGFQCPALVSAHAVVSSSAQIDGGAVVMPGAVINAGAQIGAAAIVNTACVIEHEAHVHDFAAVSPGAVLCGSVRVQNGAFIGAGAVVCDTISVGAWSVIGAGSVVCADIPRCVIAYGVPARVKESRDEKDCVFDGA